MHVDAYTRYIFLNVISNGNHFLLINHKYYMNSKWQNYRIVIHFNRCAHMQKILMFVYLFLHVQQLTCFCTVLKVVGCFMKYNISVVKRLGGSTISLYDFVNVKYHWFWECAQILHVTLFWIFFLDIKFVFVLIVLTIVWFTHMIRYLKLSMDFEFILLHIWMAFSDVLDLAEAAFCQKITKYNSQM